MDYIKKTICIEDARTKTQGLMPYYEVGTAYDEHASEDSAYSCFYVDELDLTIASGNNGNWGQFVANPCFLIESGKTYNAMLHNYYAILNMVRNGVKLRKVSTKDGDVFVEDMDSFFLSGTCLSEVTEPESLYDYAAYDANDFQSTEIDGLREEIKKAYHYGGFEEIEDQYIVLIQDFQKFNGMANYLSGITIPEELSADTISDDELNEHSVWADYCAKVDACIGKLNVPASIYNKHIKVPKSMSCADIKGYIDWLTENKNLTENCCNARLWEDMGGDDMLDFLTEYSGMCESVMSAINSFTYAVPYIEMPILLTQNYTDIGVLTNIDGIIYDEKTKYFSGASAAESADTRPHGMFQEGIAGTGFTKEEIDAFTYPGIGVTMDQIMMGSSAHTERDIEVESLLQTLRNKKKYTDDKDNVLPGDFQNFEGENQGGKMFRCIKQGEEKFYWLVVQERTNIVPITPGSTQTTREHVLYYIFSEDSTLSKEQIKDFVNERDTKGDDPNKHFYSKMPSAPSDTCKIKESDNPDTWQTLLETNKNAMSGKIATDYYLLSPISVAEAEWRMETDNVPESVTAFTNGDGMESKDVHFSKDEVENPEKKYYRTITTCEAGIRIAETEEEENGELPFMEHFYFKVKYDNSEDKPMEIPYKSGNTANVYFHSSGGTGSNKWFIYRGDFIPSKSSISTDNNKFSVDYVIGGYFSGTSAGTFIKQVYPESGDGYHEEYILDKNHVDYVALDGVDKVPVWSNYIDFKAAAKEFYSTRYGLTRTGNTATITRLNSGEVWQSKSSALTPYDAYLTKEEYLTGFSLPPKTDVNVTVDRGGVSAFESHYKLSECNTMQDLENHGNGYFFPE